MLLNARKQQAWHSPLTSMLDGKRKTVHILSFSIMAMFTLYILLWFLVFILFGYKVEGYNAYKNDRYGTASVTEGYFTTRGYDNLANYLETPFHPINNAWDSLSFSDSRYIKHELSHNKFEELLKSGTLKTSGHYIYIARHMTLYVTEYKYFSAHFCYSAPLLLPKR